MMVKKVAERKYARFKNLPADGKKLIKLATPNKTNVYESNRTNRLSRVK